MMDHLSLANQKKHEYSFTVVLMNSTRCLSCTSVSHSMPRSHQLFIQSHTKQVVKNKTDHRWHCYSFSLIRTSFKTKIRTMFSNYFIFIKYVNMSYSYHIYGSVPIIITSITNTKRYFLQIKFYLLSLGGWNRPSSRSKYIFVIPGNQC